MAGARHLVRRFFGDLLPVGPSKSNAAWAASNLTEAELEYWRMMRRSDRRHAVGVARRVAAALPDAPRPVMAAALLHDVGKLDAGLGTYGRVVATLSRVAVRGDADVIMAWTRTRGFTRRVGLYLQHDRFGGDRLELAGSDPLTVAWAREHHLGEQEWTIPVEIGRVLRQADDD